MTDTKLKQVEQARGAERIYRFYWPIVCLYVAMQLVSDVTAGKLANIFGFAVSVTVLYFPFTYIFADVLTEVYGYARARRGLWMVVICSVLAGLIYQIAVYFPSPAGFDADLAYKRVLGVVPRVLVGGWIAVFVGEIANNYVMAKMKLFFGGRYLWMRTIGSTLIGQFLNTFLFYLIGLYGVIPTNLLVESILTGWAIKVAVEAAMTPVTYVVIGALKQAEREDYFDHDTDFNPFVIR